jgi:hypothetical protein
VSTKNASSQAQLIWRVAVAVTVVWTVVYTMIHTVVWTVTVGMAVV